MAFGFGGGLLDRAMPQQFQPQFQPAPQQGGGIFDRLRQQFPQLFGQQPQAQPFMGQQPILNQQPQAQPFMGQQPILNQQVPGVQQLPFQPAISLGAPPQPPAGVQQLPLRPAVSFGAPSQGIQPFGGQPPVLNQLPMPNGREQILQNKANLGFGGIA